MSFHKLVLLNFIIIESRSRRFNIFMWTFFRNKSYSWRLNPLLHLTRHCSIVSNIRRVKPQPRAGSRVQGRRIMCAHARTRGSRRTRRTYFFPPLLSPRPPFARETGARWSRRRGWNLIREHAPRLCGENIHRWGCTIPHPVAAARCYWSGALFVPTKWLKYITPWDTADRAPSRSLWHAKLSRYNT